MGTGYTRNDTANNIADGNIINAADFDGEYDAIEAAFNSSSGHTHDGTSGEGAPVTVLGPAQDFVASTTEIKPKTNNTLDIGTSLLKFKDAHLAGTANLVNLTTTGDVTLTGAANNVVFDASDNALEFADSAKATFGDAADLQIFHDASNSIVRDSGTGILALDGSTVEIRKNDGSETMAQFVEDGAVSLYHDNSVKLATTATGVTITGSLAMDGLSLGDNEKVQLGTGTDLELYHNGTDSIIENNTGELFIQGDNVTLRSDTGTETFIAMDVNGAVELYHNNVKKFDTDADGVNVTGQIDVSTNANISGNISVLSDGGVIKLGVDEEITLTHEHNVGVQAKAASGFELNLQTGDTSVESGNVLGKITFNAPDEGSGTDAILDGAAIEAVAEATFASDNNSTALVFKTNTSAAATERMRIKSDGTIVMDTQVDIDNITIDGNTISSTDTNGNIAITPNGTGEVDITKVDIDSGAIDAVTLGTNSAVTELQVDNINVNGNAITSTDTNGNIALTPNGTGEVDISKVDIAAGEIDGTTIGANSAAAGTFTNLTASTNLTLASGATVTAILDEDNMATDSATALATQQSIKAYIATQVGAASNITDTGITFEGSSADDHETVFAITNPTADRTFTFADESGTVSTRSFAEESATALAIALG
tara:strand:- start:7651 stop:9624 length:1974 start_codon:yes stop_codon:yes gene_type:complete